MTRLSGSRLMTWVIVILAILVLLPLLGMIGMMAMGGTMMGGQMGGSGMGGMMSMSGWGLLWMVLLAAALIALIVLVVRAISRR